MNRFILFALIGLSLGGCATLDREECLSADWQLIGYNDGIAGRSSERLEQHREACADYGITPVMEDYLAGHFRGARDYCTTENGYNTARAGRSFNPICSGELRYQFEHGYRLGNEAYQQVQQFNAAEQELRQLQSDMRKARSEISSLEQQLIADGITPEKRLQLLRELEQEKADQRYLNSQIRLQKSEVEMERRYLQQLEDDLRSQL